MTASRITFPRKTENIPCQRIEFAMRIKIHRGQNQIGGSIIEIASTDAKIILDVGSGLDEDDDPVVPQIDGLFCGKVGYDAVFLSHYHIDHTGLADNILNGIPVYMGEKAFKIMRSSYEYREIRSELSPLFMKNGEPIIIKDLKITPVSCDHSAYDSYMLIIENGGKKILYTGDFRANGHGEFDKLLENLPAVDAVIIEGTTLSREYTARNIEEKKLEDIGVNAIKNSTAPCFIYCASTNIDRLITARNIAKRTDRLFLEDIYTAQMADSSGVSEIAPKRGEIYAFLTRGGDKEYNALQQFSNAKIGRDSIAKKNFLMTVRPSMTGYLEKLSELVLFSGGTLFYALWKGYQEQPYVRKFLDFMESKGVKIHTLHTSGHADSQTIDELIAKISPKKIIPVHTENAEYFKKFADKFDIILDKNEIET